MGEIILKKVLIVIPTVGTGGAERLALDITRLLDKRQFEAAILCYYDNLPDAYGSLIEDENIKIVYLNKKLGLDFSMFSKVKKAIKLINPDIIHAHLDTLLYLIPSFNKCQVKLFTVHNIACYEAKDILQRTIRAFCFHIKKVNPVAISQCFVQDIASYYRLKERQIACIPNGIDFGNFNTNKRKKTEDKIYKFITVGAMKPQKNQKLLIKAFAYVHNKNPNTQLTILGDGILRSEIEKLISVYKLEDAVNLTGIVSNVEDYLTNADAFVLSSDFEGLPLSILEAMACGLPVVSSKCGGTVDIINDGVNGYLVDTNNFEQLSDAMYRMTLLSEKERSHMNEKSSEILPRYDIKHCVADYERLYENNKIIG